jgi:hypothetical protein
MSKSNPGKSVPRSDEMIEDTPKEATAAAQAPSPAQPELRSRPADPNWLGVGSEADSDATKGSR